MPKPSKTETKEQIQEFFTDIKSKSPREIKKIKQLAMRSNFSLKEKRKKFCKKCFSPYRNSKTRINNKTKSITCENCGYVGRWKLT